ncbi:MAG TPA: hypothetical protein VGB15_24560 [Longimicrobium sp.]|jgi:hypothetical protein
MIPNDVQRSRRRRSLLRAARLVTLGVLAASCSSAAGRRERVPARLVLVGDTAEVTVPDTVARGEPFQVRVVAFAGGCRQERAGTEVSRAGQRAVITPYHYLRRSPVCTDDLVFFPHDVTLRFDEPGVAVVQVRGAANRLDFERETQWILIERRVVVR